MADQPVGVTEDLALGLIRGEVWDDFVALPRELQAEFVAWVDAAEGDENRARRTRTLIGLLRSQAGLPPLRDVTE
ncbi:MAG: hypothetical protein ACRDKT_17680 [Actinomycetota bacterium]